MRYLLESNPAFILIAVENEEFVFYNSLQHIGARLTRLEVLILELVYTYQDKTYIMSKFPTKQHIQISNAIDAIERLKLLNCEEIQYDASSDITTPYEFYLHLTYRCNLRCSYCYNKTIRRNYNTDLSINDWKIIIDKIITSAKRIIFTGGECFLYKDIAKLMAYAKSLKPDLILSAISNGMHDFKKLSKNGVFDYLSELSLSCDSLHKEGKRIGFDPIKFTENIDWIIKHKPELRLTIASVVTCDNSTDIAIIKKYCEEHKISFDKTVLLPESVSEIEYMPSLYDRINDLEHTTHSNEIQHLEKARFRCSAGKTICSIDPYGNVYPCQSLHYEEFYMGNILNVDLASLKYVNSSDFCMDTVDKMTVCSKCNVKYICGGGCMASGYSLYGKKIKCNHLTCHINYYNAIEKLKALNNRLK